MEIHLIVTFCVVSVELISAPSYGHGLYQAATNEALNRSKIEENVHNFFDSIAKKDTKLSETYRGMLEEQVTREHQAFEATNEELQTARNKNFRKRKNFYYGSDVAEHVVAKKRETDNTESTTARQFTVKPPIDLYGIGFKGTWERFCDRDQINKDSHPFLEHPVRTLRMKICYNRDLNLFTPEHVQNFAEYKYVLANRNEADALLEKLTAKLAEEGGDEKRETLFMLGKPPWKSLCFRDTQEWIRIFCIDRDNPYFTMFYELMTRACSLPLSPTDLRRIVKGECEGLRIPKVPWEPMIEKIYYTDDRYQPPTFD